MALPYDPSTGAYVSGSAMGAIPPVAPVANPLQPLHDAATLAAMAKQREAATKLQQMLLRAQVLKDQPLYAQGEGPLGVTIGQGPGGWATALGSMVAGVLAKKAHEKAGEGTAGALGELGPATQVLAENYIQGSPGGLYDTGYGMGKPRPVAQGSPLSLPLSY